MVFTKSIGIGTRGGILPFINPTPAHLSTTSTSNSVEGIGGEAYVWIVDGLVGSPIEGVSSPPEIDIPILDSEREEDGGEGEDKDGTSNGIGA